MHFARVILFCVPVDYFHFNTNMIKYIVSKGEFF